MKGDCFSHSNSVMVFLALVEDDTYTIFDTESVHFSVAAPQPLF